MDLVFLVLMSVGAYLIGSIPTAYIVVWWIKGLDIRRVGSKNVGALNAYHQVGIAGAVVVLLADAAKGVLAVLAPDWLGAPHWTVYVTAVLVVAGHNWPVFLGFQGGKGVAAVLGISLVLMPELTLIALVPTVLLVALSRNVIIGVGAGFIVVNVLGILSGQDVGQIGLCLVLTLLVVGTYLVATWEQMEAAIRTRQFRGIFYGTNLNP